MLNLKIKQIPNLYIRLANRVNCLNFKNYYFTGLILNP